MKSVKLGVIKKNILDKYSDIYVDENQDSLEYFTLLFLKEGAINE